MRIRHKLFLLMGLYMAGLIIVTTLTVYGWTRTSEIQHSVALGGTLQIKSREVQSLMKDIVFDLFAPKIYGQLRSLTYSPRSAVTIRQWQNAVYDYKNIFNDFMNLDFFLHSRDDLIRDQYLTALTMNDQAMNMLDKMEQILIVLRDKYRFAANPYNEMQKSESLVPFFREFQETSYYFANSFEGFMNYFIKTLNEAAVSLRRRMYLLFLCMVILIIAAYLAVTFLLSRELTSKLTKVEEGFRMVTRGNFDARIEIKSQDEFGALSRRFNILVDDLKNNVNSILNLTRDVGAYLSDQSGLNDLLAVFVQAIVQDTAAEAALIIRKNGDTDGVVAAQAGKVLTEEEQSFLTGFLNHRIIRPGNHFYVRDARTLGTQASSISSILAAPLVMEGTLFGILVSLRMEDGGYFSDLGATRFVTFAEFASLTLDNHNKYNELIENQEARYQALQSQVKPHFLYNVLNGFIGLNRQNDREGLEKSVLALKDMMRYIQSGSKWSSLEAEFDCIEKYCSLQKIRFGNRLDYSLELDPKARYFQIPRLLLQPLVENAVLHGIEPLERPGKLTIRGTSVRHKGEEGATIEIADNGVGFDTAELETKTNIGLENVMGRLRITWPHAVFSIESRPGEGTRVVIEV